MEYVTLMTNQLSHHSFGIMGMVLLVFALLSCFLGYRLMRAWIAIIGFCVGMIAGVGLASLFTETAWILLAAALGGGLMVALIAFKIYLVGVFLYDAIVVYGLMIGLIGQEKWWTLAICVIVALLMGILSVNFVRPVVIISTALSGGFTAVDRVLGWLSVENEILLYVLAGVLAALGMIVQFRSRKR